MNSEQLLLNLVKDLILFFQKDSPYKHTTDRYATENLSLIVYHYNVEISPYEKYYMFSVQFEPHKTPYVYFYVYNSNGDNLQVDMNNYNLQEIGQYLYTHYSKQATENSRKYNKKQSNIEAQLNLLF